MHKIFEKKFSQGIFQIYDDKPEDLTLLEVQQTHSDIVLNEDEYQNVEADGIIYSYENLTDKALAIKTADCLPILYLGENEVALVHAGWRGVHQKIHLTPKLQKIDPKQIFIAPCIHVNAFEVQPDFKENFPNSNHFVERENKLYFDLVAEALSQLQETFPNAQINTSDICTFENNQYNSYRRNKTEKRNWNIFKIK